MNTFRISDASFEYLVTQVGELDGMKAVREVWERAYERNTVERVNNILPHIPEKVSSILDVGSGLGGIDVLLYRWFDCKPHITLLDGATYDAKVERHNEPFNNARVALDFQRENGVKNVSFMSHDKLEPEEFDLIISFRAWCFHIAPRVYLEYVRSACHDRTVIIVDVRKSDAEFWRDDILNEFKYVATIEEGKKYERWKLIARDF